MQLDILYIKVYLEKYFNSNLNKICYAKGREKEKKKFYKNLFTEKKSAKLIIFNHTWIK